MRNQLWQSEAMTDALSPSTTEKHLAPIVADAIYPLSVFKRQTGLENASIRRLRQQGLIVRRVGRRSYVSGSDFIAWYNAHAEQVS